MVDRKQLRELAQRAVELDWTAEEQLRNELRPSVVLALLDQLDRIDALFSGGPDTACRTVWQDGIECVSVPLNDLRAVLSGGGE